MRENVFHSPCGTSGDVGRLRIGWGNLARSSCLIAADCLGLLVVYVVSAVMAVGMRIHLFGLEQATPLNDLLHFRLSEFGGWAVALLVWANYRGHHNCRLPFWIEARQLLSACLAMMLVDGFTQFAMKAEPSRLWVVLSWLTATPVLLAARWTAKRIMDAAGLWRLPTLIVAEAEHGREVGAVLQAHRSLGYAVVATLDFASSPSSWREICRACGARFVIVVCRGRPPEQNRRLIDGLMAEGIPHAIAPEMTGLPVLGIDWQAFLGSDVLLLSTRDRLFRPASRLIKLVFDMVVAALLFVLLAPLFGVFAALIARDGGPVIYGHRRLGCRGRMFTTYKFRTMTVQADRVLAELLEHSPAARAEWQAHYKLRDDPRITRIGRFLRETSLDELPQLFNVLAGQMSLVGPRPIIEAEVERFGEDIRFYSSIRPGMTGLWQVSGRNDTGYDERVRLNTWYVKNWSLWLDILILFKTIPIVLAGRGAY